MKFLIPFTKSRCQTGNAESDDEGVETECFSQVNDSEISTKENHDMHTSDNTQNTQDEQEEEIMDTTIQERQAQSSATNEVETQLPSTSTDVNTRSFPVPLTKKNLKQNKQALEVGNMLQCNA